MNASLFPTFPTKQKAFDWMETQVNDPYMDNYRFTFNDDPIDVDIYETLRQDGCCGSFDDVIVVDGKEATIGCNYGH